MNTYRCWIDLSEKDPSGPSRAGEGTDILAHSREAAAQAFAILADEAYMWVVEADGALTCFAVRDGVARENW